MASYTTNYNLKKPDRVDFIAIQDLNENADKIDTIILAEKEDVKVWAKRTFSNPNLLINGYLKNAVNQMGQSTYTEITNTFYIPTVDMWWVSGGTVTIDSNGMSVTKYGSLQAVTIYHHSLLRHLAGETLTLSAKIDGVIRTATGILTETSQVYTQFPNGTIWFYNPVGKAFTQVCINFTDSSTHIVEWVKFEEGEINTPCPVPKDGEELVACKYYFEKLDTYIGNYCDVAGNILLPINFTEKRVIPSVTYYGWWSIQQGYVHYQPIGQDGVDYETGVFYLSKNRAQLYLITRSDITATPAVGTFMTKNISIDARLY